MSDVENVDITLRSYSRDEDRNNQSEDELNLASGSSRPQQSSNLVGEDFRSLLNTNIRENSEMTSETTRMISGEILNQMSRKLNEIRSSLNSQIQDAITTAIAEKVLPSIQNTLGVQGRSNFTVEDRRSSGLQVSPGAVNSQKTWGNHPKSGVRRENQRQVSRRSSVDSYEGEQNCDSPRLDFFEDLILF